MEGKIFRSSSALCSFSYRPFKLAVMLYWAKLEVAVRSKAIAIAPSSLQLGKIFKSSSALRSFSYRPFNHQPFRWGTSLPNSCTTRLFRFKCKHNICIWLKPHLKAWMWSQVYFLSIVCRVKGNQFPFLTLKSLKLKYLVGSLSKHEQTATNLPVRCNAGQYSINILAEFVEFAKWPLSNIFISALGFSIAKPLLLGRVS